MRPFEIATVIMLFIAWGSYVLPVSNRPRWLVFLPSLAALTAIAQLVVEQYRWQMVPAYALAALSFVTSLPRLLGKTAVTPVGSTRRIVNVTGAVLGFVATAIATALPAAFPVFQVPEPTGIYAVGTVSFEWIDASRPEVFTPDLNDHRDLLVQVWYPAEKTSGVKPLPMWPEAKTIGPILARQFGMPGFLFDHLDLVQSHTYRGLPLANAQSAYPVLVFSHAYSPGFVGQNLVQMEELASHGYVVFSIAHPYEAAAVIYPDGRVVPTSDQRYKEVMMDGVVKAVPILKQSMAATDPVERERLFRQYLEANPHAQESVRIWTEDTIFVLNEIERMNRGEIASPLSGRLDLEHVGLFGHSMGGITAAEVCMRDSRCKAGVNIDGVQFGSVIDGSIEQPFMMMYSAINEGQNDFIYDRGHNQLYRLTVKNTVHTDYCDFPLISPLFKAVGVTGSVDPYRMETIMNRYLLAFFDQHLKGVDSTLLNGPDPSYPEVDFRVGDGRHSGYRERDADAGTVGRGTGHRALHGRLPGTGAVDLPAAGSDRVETRALSSPGLWCTMCAEDGVAGTGPIPD